MRYGEPARPCETSYLDLKDRPMLRAYRLTYSFSEYGPPQLWEWKQPFIDDLVLNARTINRRIVQ